MAESPRIVMVGRDQQSLDALEIVFAMQPSVGVEVLATATTMDDLTNVLACFDDPNEDIDAVLVEDVFFSGADEGAVEGSMEGLLKAKEFGGVILDMTDYIKGPDDFDGIEVMLGAVADAVRIIRANESVA